MICLFPSGDVDLCKEQRHCRPESESERREVRPRNVSPSPEGLNPGNRVILTWAKIGRQDLRSSFHNELQELGVTVRLCMIAILCIAQG